MSNDPAKQMPIQERLNATVVATVKAYLQQGATPAHVVGLFTGMANIAQLFKDHGKDFTPDQVVTAVNSVALACGLEPDKEKITTTADAVTPPPAKKGSRAKRSTDDVSKN